MKVLLSTDAVGGVWTFATELRAALEAIGIEVVLATLGPSPPPQPDVAYRRCALEWQDEPWDDVRSSGAWLQELAEEERVDVVHLNGYAHAALDWRVPVLVGAHSCVLSWHEAVRRAPAGPAWERYRIAVTRGLRAADIVVAPTDFMRLALRRHYGLGHHCRVISNGIAAPPAARARRVRRRRVVLAAGRLWDEAKGLDTLDAAAGRISWRVEVAGDGGGAVAQHARLLGQLDRDALRGRMGEAAIFAHPARYEPFGLVVLEAALAGCALVLGDIPSLRETWDGAALFAAPGDDLALANALERLRRNKRLRHELAARAAGRAAGRDARAMAAAYAQVYDRLHERGRRAVPA